MVARAICDKSGVVVGHAAISDVQMLNSIAFGEYVVKDPQRLCTFEDSRLPGLGRLSSSALGRETLVGDTRVFEVSRTPTELSLRERERREAGCDCTGEDFDSDETSAQVETGGRWSGFASDCDVYRRTNVGGL